MHTMKGKASKNGMIVITIVFLVILFTPFIIGFLSAGTGKKLDLALGGYTEKAEEKDFSFRSWLDRSFQTAYSNKISNDLKPRGLLIRTYNTINYLLFSRTDNSNLILGNNHYVFEVAYVNAELTLTDKDDFSLQANTDKLSCYVDQLQSLNQLLKDRGISLYVYIAPSKASVCRSEIPSAYFRQSPNHIRSVDAFRELIKKTDVPYLICSDLLDELEYPSFYPTGIHWSRTFEQYTSRRIIQDLSAATGLNYRNIEFAGIESREEPWFRDDDVWALTNVLFEPQVTYYQYKTSLEEKDVYSPLRMMIQGDSFALGLWKDIIDNDPTAEICFITRSDTVADTAGRSIMLNQDWNNMDWDYYLDHIDSVVIEATEPLIQECSFGFVPSLLTYLQSQ